MGVSNIKTTYNELMGKENATEQEAKALKDLAKKLIEEAAAKEIFRVIIVTKREE